MDRSVRIVGWSTILVSLIVIGLELITLMVTRTDEQVAELLRMFPQLQAGMPGSMSCLSVYNRVWPLYSILYFTFALAGGILFVQFRALGRKILEILFWVGLVNAAVDSIAGYVFWHDTQALLSGLTGGAGLPLAQLNTLGLGAIIVGFFLWVIPSAGMIAYLRRPSVIALMKP